LELLQAAVEKELKGRLDDPMKNKYSMKTSFKNLQEEKQMENMEFKSVEDLSAWWWRLTNNLKAELNSFLSNETQVIINQYPKFHMKKPEIK